MQWLLFFRSHHSAFHIKHCHYKYTILQICMLHASLFCHDLNFLLEKPLKQHLHNFLLKNDFIMYTIYKHCMAFFNKGSKTCCLWHNIPDWEHSYFTQLPWTGSHLQMTLAPGNLLFKTKTSLEQHLEDTVEYLHYFWPLASFSQVHIALNERNY